MFAQTAQPGADRIGGQASPLSLLRRWPRSERVALLLSGRPHPRWARWSIFAPVRGWIRAFGDRVERLDEHGDVQSTTYSADPVASLNEIFDGHAAAPIGDDDVPPFQGGWIGSLGYELGARIEPKVPVTSASTGAHLLWSMAWCPAGFVFDHRHQQWWKVGDHEQIGMLNTMLVADSDRRTWPDAHLGMLSPRQNRGEVERSVARAIEYINAGDVFQVNIAQQFLASFEGCPRSLFARAMDSSPAWYAACLEGPGVPNDAILSISPELFLEFDPSTRRVITRPVKGTAPGHLDAAILEKSEKDRAELAMIVDLMRNDLGRVCEFGSIEVVEPRTIESHPTVHHGVGTVSGRLRPDASLKDLLCATFPGGSITGAPKIRAMQIINELEPVPRGPYCGAIGFVSLTGALSFNIAIRTMLIRGNRLFYSAGGGIVADSRPDLEYDEMLAKVAAVRGLTSSAGANEIGGTIVAPESLISVP